MKIFVSWSGKRSKELAKLLKDWLPKVIQQCDLWFSEEIPSGAWWPQEILTNLNSAAFGIVCVTPENLNASWLLYETGALATQMGKDRLVCPLLLGMDKEQLGSPLSLFQAKNATDKEDVFKLLKDINDNIDFNQIGGRILEDTFSKNWDEFNSRVKEIEQMSIPSDSISGKVAAVSNLSFDCTQEEFVNHLSACNEVTILGITNGNLHNYLDRAWEKRKRFKKEPWDKIEIIFLAQHLLKDIAFPDISGPLESRNRQWEDGVEKARNFLRSSTNPDKPDGYRAKHVEIRSYDKPFPFIGQVYDDKRIRVAYILPDKDIKTSCYLNLVRESPPCKELSNQQRPVLENKNSPPCKKLDSLQVSCEYCTWEREHSPCYAIYNTFKKISAGSTPLLAANIVGWIENKQKTNDLQFIFSTLRPQNNWRKTLKSVVLDKPAHLLSFILLRYKDKACLQFRNEKNSSGEFNKYGILPGKVNDVDFFDGPPDEIYREQVYKMQKAWDQLDPYSIHTEYIESCQNASAMFAKKTNIQIGRPITNDLLDKACTRAAKRSIREKIRLEISEDRLKPVKRSFMVVQGEYELFICFFVLGLDKIELNNISNPDIALKTTDEIKTLKGEGKLTDFLMKYTDEVLDELQVENQKELKTR